MVKRMRFVFSAVVAVAVFMLAPPAARQADAFDFSYKFCGTMECSIGVIPDPRTEDLPDDIPMPVAPTEEEIAQEALRKQQLQLKVEAFTLNEQGVEALRKFDYVGAVALFEQASSRTPDDTIIRGNIAFAKNVLEKQKQDSKTVGDIQAEIEKAIAALREKKVTGGGLQFVQVLPKKEKQAGTLPPVAEEIENSPGAEAARRGLDAARRGDWQLALAWYQTAQLRDPSNPSLRRAVEAAQWSWNLRRKAAKPEASQVPTEADLKFMIPEVREKVAGVKAALGKDTSYREYLSDITLHQMIKDVSRTQAHVYSDEALRQLDRGNLKEATEYLSASQQLDPENRSYAELLSALERWSREESKK